VKTSMETIELAEFDRKSLEELHAIARERGLEVEENIRKQELIQRILQAHTDSNGQVLAEGVLEILPDGWGFLRQRHQPRRRWYGRHLRFADPD
jgi:transcription termination factor Rho